LAEEFEGEVVFFGASNNDTVEAGMDYVEEFDVPYDLALAPEVWELFGNPYRPTTIVFDATGREAQRVDGPISYEGLKATLESLTS
jgi:hypothetical protein